MPDSKEIFALDIGTRNVVGLVGCKESQSFRVIANEIFEHPTRSMLDGQIHDIDAVAQIVKVVKERLENKLGHPLREVAVAAAGRALKTVRGSAAIETFSLNELDRQQVLGLELAAVQRAQADLANNEPDSLSYQCVGYSVVGYRLDGSPITSLLHHRGSVIETEVIATFLPRSVVDSLYSVLSQCGLSLKTLTLEPIAALNVVLPPNMRTLNLALVDIGAGTSDIALVAAGKIQNYAMVPMAGDEITEYLCQQYLLSFDQGESLKRSLDTTKTVVFTDVIGFTQEIDASQVTKTLLPGVQHLAEAIGQKILELNGEAPAAVILIGGGSLTPVLSSQLAKALSLPETRVAVRGREAITNLLGELADLQGPEFVTPVGIAVTSLNDQALNMLQAEVNKRLVRLFSINKGTVGDALLAAGYSLRKLHGRPGMALSVTVNGEFKVIKGEMGVSAVIRLNGEIVELNTPLHNNDSIEVTPARDGNPAKAVVRDVIKDYPEFSVVINGRNILVSPRISMNQSLVSPQTSLLDRAEIIYEKIETVGDLLNHLEIDPPQSDSLTVYINSRPRILKFNRETIYLNGNPCDLDTTIAPGDSIRLTDELIPTWRVSDVISVSRPMFIDITVNGQARTFPAPRDQVKLNGQIAYGDEPLQDGFRIEFVEGRKELLFADLFKYLDFQASPPNGKSHLTMQINGLQAEFTSIIHNGDFVRLTWD